MKRTIALLIMLCLAGAAFAQDKRGPSTPEERAKAVQVAKALENDPLAATMRPEREWFIKWIIEVPDITISPCSVSVLLRRSTSTEATC